MIYHITTQAEWAGYSKENNYAPIAFAVEGFIHCCSKAQVEGVLQRYFQGKTDLLLLEVDESKLTALLKFEPATNHELFPHVYGVINKDAINKIEPL